MTETIPVRPHERRVLVLACQQCGKGGEQVRGCCPEHPGVQLCDACYLRPDSPHAAR